MPDNLALLKFDFDGAAGWYDFTNMIEKVQTDTKLVVNLPERVLKFFAERHEDDISAQELGSILHLVNLGDVDGNNVEDNSMLFYKKANNCAAGCEGINNAWQAWNAAEEQTPELQTIMGFDADGAPHALEAPVNASQYYQLGWNGNNKVSYSQPQTTSIAAVTDADNKVSVLVLDPTTKQIKAIKLDAAKLEELEEADD